MLERYFHLSRNNTSAKREILCGFTTFLTMIYILFTNSSILSKAGMPWQGTFVATALSAGLCTVFVALFANLPFAMAPGMGINTIFSYTICMGMGYHWKEALAIVFVSGMLHLFIMLTPLRKSFVNAFPPYLRVAASIGLGMFIAYIGIKNTGLLTFSFPSDQHQALSDQFLVGGALVVPELIKGFSSAHVVAIISLTVMIMLSALERKTGDKYAALPLGILIATFIGIPLGVTRLTEISATESYISEGFVHVFLSFFGKPGLLSVFSGPSRAPRTILLISILLMTGILDSVGTMIGLGQIHNAKVFDATDMENFSKKGISSKLDRALISNSLGGIITPLLGSSTSTIYLESVTGIVSGGRTGLTGLITGALFLLCLPMASFFHIIPSEAVAPALILAGVSMLTRMKHIDWINFEESFPSFITILFMPLSFSILDGISFGILSHVAIRLTMGNRRDVHPLLFVISALYIIFKVSECFY